MKSNEGLQPGDALLRIAKPGVNSCSVKCGKHIAGLIGFSAVRELFPVADRSIRIVKTVRILKKNRVRVSQEPGQTKYLREPLVEHSTNFYASNLVLGTIPPLFLHQLGRSRSTIDAQVFQTITTDGHLKKASVYQQRARALVVLTMIRVLAYTLTLVFYHRQVRSHFRKTSIGFRELARKLAYPFLSDPQNSS